MEKMAINLKPKYIGPGAWYTLHKMASCIRTQDDINAVLYLINLFRTELFCLECQEHFDSFCKKYPPDRYAKLQPQEKLFWWTWCAHNNANKLTNKPEFSYEEAYRIYYKTRATKLDPEYVGPGAWYVLHKMASTANESNINFTLYLINIFRKELFCKECQKYFDNFCKIYPPETYTNIRQHQEKFFWWTWHLHNNVNSHMNKKDLIYKETYLAYYKVEQCELSCDLKS